MVRAPFRLSFGGLSLVNRDHLRARCGQLERIGLPGFLGKPRIPTGDDVLVVAVGVTLEPEYAGPEVRRYNGADIPGLGAPRPASRRFRNALAGYTSGGEQQMCLIGRAMMARPKLVLLDEPSMGLAPQVVEEIFEIVRGLNEREGVSFLLAEQNTNIAPHYASFGYILETGRVVLDGAAEALRTNEDVREFYLGVAGENRRSFKHVKTYKRRKRWLA